MRFVSPLVAGFLIVAALGIAPNACAQSGSEDLPAPLADLLSNAADLAYGTPQLSSLAGSGSNNAAVIEAAISSATLVQSDISQLYSLVGRTGSGGGGNNSQVRQNAVAVRTATDPQSLLAALLQTAATVQQDAAQFQALVNASTKPSADVLGQLTAISRDDAALSTSLTKLIATWTGAAPQTIRVAAGGDFQAAIDAANPGDTIVLTAGATYSGNFLLRNKSGYGWITITTSASGSLPPDGVRLTPAQSALLPKIVTPNNMRAIETDPGAHHYRLIGLEVLPAPGTYSLGLISIGQTDNTLASSVPHDFYLSHLYIHGDPTVGEKYGIRLEAAQVSVVDSTISDIKSDWQDSQAITGCNGNGPFTILNNHLEASGENVMWGGCGSLAGVIPSDIVLRGNHFYKPLSWQGTKWQVKNSFEIKNGQRVRIVGNVFENCWVSAQSGFMLQLTPRVLDNGTPGVVRDVIFEHNVFTNSPAGVTILGWDNLAGNVGEVKNITFSDNLFKNFGDPSISPKLFQLLGPLYNIVWDHNTALISVGAWISIERPFSGAVVTNNILSQADYGVFSSSDPMDGPTIQQYMPGGSFSNNVVIGGEGFPFPASNYLTVGLQDVGFLDLTSYKLSPSSSYQGICTDGSTPGFNSDLVQAFANMALSGSTL